MNNQRQTDRLDTLLRQPWYRTYALSLYVATVAIVGIILAVVGIIAAQ